ncbi:unnamed protein product, partial [Didymodactylos carnosus]
MKTFKYCLSFPRSFLFPAFLICLYRTSLKDYEFLVKLFGEFHDDTLKSQLINEWEKLQSIQNNEEHFEYDDSDDKLARNQQHTQIEEALEEILREKARGWYHDLQNKTGPLYEKANNKLQEIKKKYFTTANLFSKTSLSLIGFKYVINNWSTLRSTDRVYKPLDVVWASIKEDPVEISSAVLKVLVLVLAICAIFIPVPPIIALSGSILLISVTSAVATSNIVHEYDSYVANLINQEMAEVHKSLTSLKNFIQQRWGEAKDDEDRPSESENKQANNEASSSNESAAKTPTTQM